MTVPPHQNHGGGILEILPHFFLVHLEKSTEGCKPYGCRVQGFKFLIHPHLGFRDFIKTSGLIYQFAWSSGCKQKLGVCVLWAPASPAAEWELSALRPQFSARFRKTTRLFVVSSVFLFVFIIDRSTFFVSALYIYKFKSETNYI